MNYIVAFLELQEIEILSKTRLGPASHNVSQSQGLSASFSRFVLGRIFAFFWPAWCVEAAEFLASNLRHPRLAAELPQIVHRQSLILAAYFSPACFPAIRFSQSAAIILQ